MLHITRIEISDILGTRHCVFEPGTLTVISGANGSGKSSILDGIKKCFAGGHDPGLLRRGAKFGEIVLSLSNKATIRARVTAKQTTYEVTGPDGLLINAPRSYIDQLGEALAVDPSRILTAKPKELADELIRIMPVAFEFDEVQAAAGEETWSTSPRTLSLDEFDVLCKQIFDTRTQVNRTIRDQEGLLKNLRNSLPADDGHDWAQRAAELRETLAEARQQREADIEAINRAEREAIEEIRARAIREVDKVKAEAATKRREVDTGFEPQLAKISAAVSTAEERQRAQDNAQGVRQSIQAAEEQYEKNTAIAGRLTQALERLKALKETKLASLPIPGLEVREGQVYLDGVPFEHVNLAERIRVALKVSSLRSGDLPFLILDNSEAMDSETWQAFCEGVQRKGLQVIAARVSDRPLKIESLQEQPLLAAV